MATIAGDLDARWIIHTAGPVYSGTPRDAELLASCHRSVLRVADELGARTVAFPAISTGVFGYPVEQAAPIAIAAVREAEHRGRAGALRAVLRARPRGLPRRARRAPAEPLTSKPTPLVAFAPAMSDQATNETLSDVRTVHDRLAEIQLVDCRELYEWEAGRIDGAVYLPLNSIMAGAGADLDHDTPIAVICRSGNRSELATMMLQARGFEAYNVEGGMEAWAAAGLPFSRRRRLPRPRRLSAPSPSIAGRPATRRPGTWCRPLPRPSRRRSRARTAPRTARATAPGCSGETRSIQPRTRNSPPSPSWSPGSIAECIA